MTTWAFVWLMGWHMSPFATFMIVWSMIGVVFFMIVAIMRGR